MLWVWYALMIFDPNQRLNQGIQHDIFWGHLELRQGLGQVGQALSIELPDEGREPTPVWTAWVFKKRNVEIRWDKSRVFKKMGGVEKMLKGSSSVFLACKIVSKSNKNRSFNDKKADLLPNTPHTLQSHVQNSLQGFKGSKWCIQIKKNMSNAWKVQHVQSFVWQQNVAQKNTNNKTFGKLEKIARKQKKHIYVNNKKLNSNTAWNYCHFPPEKSSLFHFTSLPEKIPPPP